MAFLNKDISLKKRQTGKKLASAKQAKLIELFHNLSQSGFSLSEMVAFLEKSKIIGQDYCLRMRNDLIGGRSLSEMMENLGYPEGIVTQLSLAEAHGNTENSLAKIKDYINQSRYIRQKTLEVVTYPIILLTFLVVIVFGLRHYLLPQIDQKNALTSFLSHFPIILLTTAITLLAVALFATIRWHKMERMKQLQSYARLPLVSPFIKSYMTAYYAREWGNLIAQGIELSDILGIMISEKSVLMQELGRDMQRSFIEGKALHEKVKEYSFFHDELSLMIEYGQVKGKLGQELEIYAQLVWESYFRRLLQATQMIQPLIFLGVALIIVMIYAALLLPMYHNIGGNI